MQREPVLARRPLVAGIFALAVGMGIGRFAFTPILPAMRDAFALSPVTLGALASANYLGYLVGAVAAIAPLPQRTHQWVLRISLVTVVVSTALMGGTTAPPLWIVLRWVAGLASAGVFIFSATIVLGWCRITLLQERKRGDGSGWPWRSSPRS